MEAQKIKIELEMTPQIALLISMYLRALYADDPSVFNLFRASQIQELLDIGQSLVEQLCSKTDPEYVRLRTLLLSLKDDKNDDYLQQKLKDLLN